jgi:hypothetical protein
VGGKPATHYDDKGDWMMQRFAGFLMFVACLGLASTPQARAATQDWTGCAVTSYYSVDPGPKLSTSWSVSGERRVIAFHADKIVLGGGKGLMSPAQFARWDPILSELRNAASQKVKVRVFYDDATRDVLGINVLYDQGC